MDNRLVDMSDADALLAEVDRLRSEIARLEERVQLLDQLAHQDSLIDLPNRRGFMRQLERLIDRVARYGDSAAMLFVDIDGLKSINDTFGHPAGDEALIQVAEMLVGGVRKGDCVARLGGDEFGILLDQADEASARETAARLVEHVAGSEFCFEGTCLPLSVAIGVGMIESGDCAEAVMARADQAMYAEKAAA
ncbi:MAG TPA: GGDEF domain-containing protein [Reyranellaceae bacterium]|nr:GGDEF domain-containing protein [Reyranellaceae bacterium]